MNILFLFKKEAIYLQRELGFTEEIQASLGSDNKAISPSIVYCANLLLKS